MKFAFYCILRRQKKPRKPLEAPEALRSPWGIVKAVNTKAINQRKILSIYREKIRNQAFPGKEKKKKKPKPVGFCENSPRKGRSQPVAHSQMLPRRSVNSTPLPASPDPHWVIWTQLHKGNRGISLHGGPSNLCLDPELIWGLTRSRGRAEARRKGPLWVGLGEWEGGVKEVGALLYAPEVNSLGLNLGCLLTSVWFLDAFLNLSVH